MAKQIHFFATSFLVSSCPPKPRLRHEWSHSGNSITVVRTLARLLLQSLFQQEHAEFRAHCIVFNLYVNMSNLLTMKLFDFLPLKHTVRKLYYLPYAAWSADSMCLLYVRTVYTYGFFARHTRRLGFTKYCHPEKDLCRRCHDVTLLGSYISPFIT